MDTSPINSPQLASAMLSHLFRDLQADKRDVLQHDSLHILYATIFLSAFRATFPQMGEWRQDLCVCVYKGDFRKAVVHHARV